MNFLEANNEQERFTILTQMKDSFYKRAAQVDEAGSFPFENMEELKASGYTALTLPKQYGGGGITLSELLDLQQCIAEGDGATALSIGWHMGIIQSIFERKNWNHDLLTKLAEDVKKGALINGAASEMQTGSPTRGGKPATAAGLKNDKWTIKGRKTFTTMAPVLDYFVVSATIQGDGRVGNFLIHRSTPGISIEETWDSIAMRGTGSHDLVLHNVVLEKEALVEYITPGQKGASGWLLHIPACYLGIAKAAQTYSIRFANEYAPNSIKGSIIELPNVQQKIGEMELELLKSHAFLMSTAKKWDELSAADRQGMTPLLSAVKMEATNAAIKVVDLAMRLTGARSLSLKNPLQRYYRDVRAGLHNPPMDDMTIMMLAKHAIELVPPTDEINNNHQGA